MTEALPKSVQNQADAADALHQETYAPKADEPGEGAKPTEQPAEHDDLDPQPVEPEPKPDPEPETRDAAYWRHRFEVMQGKYNSEVPQLRSELKTLQDEIERLKQDAEKAKDAPGNDPGKSFDEMKQQILDGLPADQLEDYGDMVDFMTKIALNAAQTAAPGTTTPTNDGDLREEVQQLKQERAEDRHARFMADLTAKVPNWRKIQDTDKAQRWLMTFDPQTGKQRDQLLNDAAAQYDLATVVAMYQEMEALTPPPKEPPADRVQPDTSRATTAQPQEGNVWTRDDINQFYRDKAAGRFTEEEAADYEKDIFAAQREGRIR